MADAAQRLNGMADSYVFVVTYGRSGSTLLQNVLNSIPGYCIRGENADTLGLLALAWHAVETEEPMRGARSSGRKTEAGEPWYGAEKVKPALYGQSLARVFNREVLNLPQGTRVGGFKEIRFGRQTAQFRPKMQFLRRFFPNARFIFNTRDHASVAKSGWWKDMPADKVKATLTASETMFDSWMATCPELCLKMHYDDYTGQPEAMRRLFTFLGESFDLDRVSEVMDRQVMHMKT